MTSTDYFRDAFGDTAEAQARRDNLNELRRRSFEGDNAAIDALIALDEGAAAAEAEVEVEIDDEEEEAEAPVLTFAMLADAEAGRREDLKTRLSGVEIASTAIETTETPGTEDEASDDETSGMSDEIIDKLLRGAASRPRPRPRKTDVEDTDEDESSNDGGARGTGRLPRDPGEVFDSLVRTGKGSNRVHSLDHARQRRKSRPASFQEPTN